MLINDIVYQDGKYYCYLDKKKDCYNIVKEGFMYGTIVGYASTFEQAKESIKWHQQMDKEEN